MYFQMGTGWAQTKTIDSSYNNKLDTLDSGI